MTWSPAVMAGASTGSVIGVCGTGIFRSLTSFLDAIVSRSVTKLKGSALFFTLGGRSDALNFTMPTSIVCPVPKYG